ncbi:MAG: hypothetical protein QW815_00315 [Nitrososphaerota archaeon]
MKSTTEVKSETLYSNPLLWVVGHTEEEGYHAVEIRVANPHKIFNNPTFHIDFSFNIPSTITVTLPPSKTLMGAIKSYHTSERDEGEITQRMVNDFIVSIEGDLQYLLSKFQRWVSELSSVQLMELPEPEKSELVDQLKSVVTSHLPNLSKEEINVSLTVWTEKFHVSLDPQFSFTRGQPQIYFTTSLHVTVVMEITPTRSHRRTKLNQIKQTITNFSSMGDISPILRHAENVIRKFFVSKVREITIPLVEKIRNATQTSLSSYIYLYVSQNVDYALEEKFFNHLKQHYINFVPEKVSVDIEEKVEPRGVSTYTLTSSRRGYEVENYFTFTVYPTEEYYDKFKSNLSGQKSVDQALIHLISLITLIPELKILNNELGILGHAKEGSLLEKLVDLLEFLSKER